MVELRRGSMAGTGSASYFIAPNNSSTRTNIYRYSRKIAPTPGPLILGLPLNTRSAAQESSYRSSTIRNLTPVSAVGPVASGNPGASSDSHMGIDPLVAGDPTLDVGRDEARSSDINIADPTLMAESIAAKADKSNFPMGSFGTSAGSVARYPLAVILVEQTITDGMAPVTFDGRLVAYQSGLLRVGSDSHSIAATQVVADYGPIKVGGLDFSAISSLTQTGYNTPPQDTEYATDGETIAFQDEQPAGLASLITIEGPVHTSSSYAVNAAGSTLSPGGTVITIDGTLILSGLSYNAASNQEKTTALDLDSTARLVCVPVGSQTITVDHHAALVAGATLRPGDPTIIVDGTVVSLGLSELILGSYTTNVDSAGAARTARPSIEIETVDIAVAGTTLIPGSAAVTVDGTKLSLRRSVLVVGSKTQAPTFSNDPLSIDVGIEAITTSGFGATESRSAAMPSQLTIANSSAAGNSSLLIFIGKATGYILP